MVNCSTNLTDWVVSRAKKTHDVGSTVTRSERTWMRVLITATFIPAGIFGCFGRRSQDAEQLQGMSQKTIKQAQEEHTSQWMAIDGVEGTAIGLYKGKPCIKVFSSKKAEDLLGVIPSTIEGYPVIIEETGKFRALDQQ